MYRLANCGTLICALLLSSCGGGKLFLMHGMVGGVDSPITFAFQGT